MRYALIALALVACGSPVVTADAGGDGGSAGDAPSLACEGCVPVCTGAVGEIMCSHVPGAPGGDCTGCVPRCTDETLTPTCMTGPSGAVCDPDHPAAQTCVLP